MKTNTTTYRFNHKRGQVLPVSIIILAVLLVLGFVFLGILNRNIQQSATGQRRSQAEDLARAAADYVHKQLQFSYLHADYRPPTIELAGTGIDFTRDPDAFQIRPGTGLGLRNPADTVQDKGGPDGLGPYSRFMFEGGRALVRVRYGPSEANIFDASPTGPLTQPGKARSYLIIEVIGKVGRIDPNDPTTLLANSGVKFRNYASWAEYRQNYEDMKTRDTLFVSSRKLIAFASIGLIEHSLYVTNLDDSSRPAELGVDFDNGAQFNGITLAPPVDFGGQADGPAGSPYQGLGSVWINSDLRVFGNVRAFLNSTLGDQFVVAGSIVGGNNSASLTINQTFDDQSSTASDNNIVLQNTGSTFNGGATTASLDSSAAGFLTFSNTFRDGIESTDVQGWPRYARRKAPPRISQLDPANNTNPYLQSTQQSGILNASGNTGRNGHGQGVYVGNTADRQIGIDEDSREVVGSQESMPYDWLNPNNGQPNSGWQGQWYIPVGAFLEFKYDGFTITRDGRAPANQRTWRRLDGSDSGLTSLRYRIGGDPDGAGPQPPYIINAITNPGDIDAANPVWTNGFPFNGLLYFEGNVRVLGTIPTDVQLTVVSMANIYIEGSIMKGNVVDVAGTRLNRPSRSACMLMAKDYVVLNTTQFFRAGGGTGLEEVNETNDPLAGNAIRMHAAGGSLNYAASFALRNENVAGLPGITANNPQTWRPFAIDYVDPATNNPIDTMMLFTHTADAGAAPNTFISADVNFGVGTSTYNFVMDGDNSASPPYALGTWQPIKGLGSQPWQIYPATETKGFPLIRPASVNFAGYTLTANEPAREGTYNLFVGHAGNQITIRPTNIGGAPTNDYVVRRAAITPYDVRIEAGIYAETGSFFVIPGRWFNPNPNDTRQAWSGLGATNATRNAQRKSLYGVSPEAPFYGEPLDVRVTIIGSVSENMTQPAAVQAEWAKKWGWIPREQGSSGVLIPSAHVPPGYNIVTTDNWVPNLTIIQDPVFATGRITGFQDVPNSYVRFQRVTPSPGVSIDYALAPMPRLPVSPTLAYYGEVNP